MHYYKGNNVSANNGTLYSRNKIKIGSIIYDISKSYPKMLRCKPHHSQVGSKHNENKTLCKHIQ